MTTAALGRGGWAADVAWAVLALGVCLVLAAATLASPQLGCAVALLTLVIGLATRSLAAGICVVWLVWLLAPLLRRVFALEGNLLNADPLSLVPFVSTVAVAVVALVRYGWPAREARTVPLLAATGFALGVPVGVLVSPTAAAFAAFAYAAALAGFVLGYHDRGVAGGTLTRTLALAAPALALYGVYQYVELPAWDRTWLERTSFVVALGPEDDRVRIWSTLNAPNTLGMVLGLALVTTLVAPRFGPARLAALAIVIVGLALTYVRSAWVALAVALVVIVVASRGRFAPRLAVAFAVAFVGLPALAAGTPTGDAVIGRFDTLSGLEADTSAQERRQTASVLFPRAVTEPLGSGLGSAGEASRLADASGFRYTDNAYLSLLYQVGPFGFALVLAAIAAGFRGAWRLARRDGSGPAEWGLIGMLAFMAAGMLTGDLLYGLTGVAFWYVLGLASRREHGER
jgi:hypothetical protein